ncbi:MAG: recombinase family protein [Oscillospiraceae bacterium]|nr:recombinase family protein [Oscillospiraceae bacterium]
MNQYCMYLRKSRADAEAEKRGEGETLARHEKTLFELARRYKFNISEVYREIVSGETIAARPVMQQLLSEISEGMWTGVLVMEVERLARGDTIDQGMVMQAFKYSETRIITPMKTYDPNNEFDEEYFEFGLFMSRREYKTINRRLQQGRITSVKEGKWLAQAPYGYQKSKLKNDKGYTLTPQSDESEVVKMIFELYTDGEIIEDGTQRRLGFAAIATRLNQLKIPPSRHDYWMQSVVKRIIQNPVYIGKVRWGQRPQKKKTVNGRIVVTRPIRDSGGDIVYDDFIIADGLHEAIIDEEMFNSAQKYIEEIPPMPIGYKKELKNPLAGLVFCQKCGRSMVYRKGTTEKSPAYIVCHARACDNVSSPFALIESRVLEGLREWLNDYKLNWGNAEFQQRQKKSKTKSGSKVAVKINALKTLKSEIETLEKQLSKTYDLLEQEVYSTDEFLNRSREITSNIEKARREHTELEKSIELETAYEERRKAIIPQVERLLDVYYELPTPADKNALLKEVLEKTVYLKLVSGKSKKGTADCFELDLFPKLPSNNKSGE